MGNTLQLTGHAVKRYLRRPATDRNSALAPLREFPDGLGRNL
jgi:hypothetical protein